MRNYLIRRLMMMVPLLLGISLLSFIIMQLAPGDPAALKAGMNPHVDPNYILKLRASYGLNDPLMTQYWHWLVRICRLDFGTSFMDNRPVLDVIAERLPATFLLSGLSLVLLFVIAVPMGVAAAYYQNSWLDRSVSVFAFIGYSVPSYWFALLLMLFFGVQMNLLPISGMMSTEADYLPWYEKIGDLLSHLILPLVVTTFSGLASVSLYARTSMLEVIRQDYIRTARAKGLSETQVVFKHALRNALIPIVTVMGLSLPGLIGGSFIIETLFAWPGMGQLGLQSVFTHDYPLIMGIGVITAVLTLLGNLLADIAYALLDPRIRYD
jgi:peptide/nickel transport system permease protein